MLRSWIRLQAASLTRSPVAHSYRKYSSSSAKATLPAMSSNPSTSAAPAADGSEAPAAPTKSALKRMEKEAALAAKKALKKASGGPSPAAASGEKKEKKEKKKEAAPAEPEPEFIDVPAGQFKDLSQRMASGYNPTDVEKSWYSWWEQSSYFIPALPSENPSEYSFYDAEPNFLPRDQTGHADFDKVDRKKTFVIPFPPPNVTGSLHIGHALANALQDTMIRWKRMQGYTTLFVPGFDHASISTQSVVEKRLMKNRGLTRHDLGREEFLKVCMDWKNEYQGKITRQLQRLGVSCDWQRVAFTMDENLSAAVAESFVKLHEEGVIYRANRLVNWCVQMNTTLSSLELEQKDLAGRTELSVPGYPPNEKFVFGVITSFAYEIVDSTEKIIIATTRPETMLGDTAIAVHPTDERYKHLHGKFARHPFIPERKIPIITDDKAVDMSFGTGAVKMTPAHDPNDYEVGVRHQLEFINILNDDGTLNENAGPFKGMKRFHARVAVVEKLKEMGLYVEENDNPMTIPLCAKSGDIIESVMKPQWWVSCKKLAEEALAHTAGTKEAEAAGRTNPDELLKIQPSSSAKEWENWLGGIQDWCISRQLWWGHRAPAYYVKVEGEQEDRMDASKWVSGASREIAQEKADAKFAGKKFTLEQDEDVLDTWFSSGLWPWSIQGWPKDHPDLKAFYPSSVLETGWDILFFWVARMVMLGLKMTGELPFKEVFCHAMIRDAHGRKMSKTLGNVIDPIDVIEGAKLEDLHAQLRMGNIAEKEILIAEKGQKKDFPNGIPQCGTDALRFALANYSSYGRDINLEILRVEGYRKFCNKLWNATKFAMLKLYGEEIPGEAGSDRKFKPFVPRDSQKPTGNESLVEKWILQKLNHATAVVNKALEERNFMAASGKAYDFWLYEICDVYIEAIKLVTDPDAPAEARVSAQNTLYTVLDNGLRLLHPLMPYVTEELWQRLPRRPSDKTKSIMLARYPETESSRQFESEEKDFDLAFSGVRAVRTIAAPYGLSSNVQVLLLARQPELAKTISAAADSLKVLIKGCTSFKVIESEADVPVGCVSENVSPNLAVYLLLKGVVNADAEIAKAEKKRAFTKNALEKLQNGMQAPDYETKKPEAVRKKDSEKVGELQIEIDSLTAAIESFMKLK